MSEPMRFDDDVVIVTGAGRGLGREYALAFAARGAAVLVNDPGVAPDGSGGEASVAQAVVDEIKSGGGRAVADMHSVATTEGAAAIIAAARKAFKSATVLVNNAGIITFAPLVETGADDWQRMLDVTLTGAFNMARAVWPGMAAQGYGRIVNTTSNAGFAGSAQLVAYGAAKMGVAGLTKALAQEAVGTGITVNAIAPMAVTRMNRDAFFSGTEPDEDWVAAIARGEVPMGPPAIVAPTVLWLAHHTTAVNGEVFSSSSGKVARVGFVVGEGYFDPTHSPEDLGAAVERVRNLGSYLDLSSTMDELAAIPALFDGSKRR